MANWAGRGLSVRVVAVALCLATVFGASPQSAPSDIQQQTAKDAKPWFCHDLECPKYDVLKSYQAGTIELRSYEKSSWASTNVSDSSYDAAVRTGFYRLFRYISGANVGSVKIDMTAPVKVRCVAGAGPFCESHFIISFMVPFKLQDAPPAPTSKDVYLENADAAKYYVAAFSGFSDESKLVKHASDLLADLDAQGLKYDDSHFFSAGYDAPFRLTNRHNEVWVPAV